MEIKGWEEIVGIVNKAIPKSPSIPFFLYKIDGLVKSPKKHYYVIPVKTGIQSFQRFIANLDSRFRENDDFLRVHQNWKKKTIT